MKIEFSAILKYISMIFIIIFIIFLIKSIIIYKKYTNAKSLYLISLKHKENLNSKFNNIIKIKILKTILGHHNIEAYLFTFLSFSNYIKSKGYDVNPYLILNNKSTNNINKTKTVIQNIGKYKNLSLYIINSNRFYSIKKISLKLTIKNYSNFKNVLKIISDIQSLFPTNINSIMITNKLAVINFNIYGEE